MRKVLGMGADWDTESVESTDSEELEIRNMSRMNMGKRGRMKGNENNSRLNTGEKTLAQRQAAKKYFSSHKT
ncbi:hypothetical protein NEOLI_003293 [Neolecta irregularis DAH-3]|uniref:Uncharacterized protein n=1 Tax=Neolecta irregularis (strain DAH-3) TaxID=1198029 RepID=A0A1U7LS07_NEOID|nr:hypothetical protein NEOLI_003293 [Neolecta irregularis DAH-3]|eukprot:OLL25332.1 hypothetical protein NEOLI_003293 [Neolecta irregularis DAH-3]